MRRLICAFVVRKTPKTDFLGTRPIYYLGITLDSQQSKKFILLTNVDKKMLEIEFLIAICRQ